MAGIPSLRLKIANAAASGKASWEGNNGIKVQNTEIADIMQQRGVKVVETTGALSALTGEDTWLVILKNVALYAFNPFAFTTNPLDYPASGGGRWEFICKVGKPYHRQVIGNGIATSFTIAHGLDKPVPTVKVLDTGNGASPYYFNTDAQIAVIDNDTIQLTYVTPPGTYQFTVEVE